MGHQMCFLRWLQNSPLEPSYYADLDAKVNFSKGMFILISDGSIIYLVWCAVNIYDNYFKP
jgi:hypothetical protein